jgi:uncharacterized protein YdhG (YjbR/CyaY superfamily)
LLDLIALMKNELPAESRDSQMTRRPDSHLAGAPIAKTGFNSVDEYIASQPEAVQGILKRVRSTIRQAVPGSEEVISYKIPTYKLHGRPVLYFAGWSQHYSLYPATDRVVAAFKDDLAPYKVNKGTIRFPLSQPVPVKLIERIAKFRAKEIAEREKLKASAPNKR